MTTQIQPAEPFKCRYCPCTFFHATDYKGHLRKYNPNASQLVNLSDEQIDNVIKKEHLQNWLRDVAKRP